jgi:hypothetical protein
LAVPKPLLPELLLAVVYEVQGFAVEQLLEPVELLKVLLVHPLVACLFLEGQEWASVSSIAACLVDSLILI